MVLCSLNVFGVCKMDCCVRSCYCICLIVLFVYCGVVWWYWRGIDCGIDCCVRAMSPKGGDTPAKPRAQALG